MTEVEFENLKVNILKNGHHRSPSRWSEHAWWFSCGGLYLRYNSPKSKYRGSIVVVSKIKNDKINAVCSISGAPKISPFCHYKHYELTTETQQRYVDSTAGSVIIKDFFNDDINVGDYVFGEYDRCVIFGKVQSTKLGCGKKKGYRSLKHEFDAAMIEVVSIVSRDGFKIDPGHNRLLEMKYFIKIEDPTLYLLKL